MARGIFAVFAAVLCVVLSARAQNFSGTYILQDGEGSTTLTVQQDGSGNVQGQITMTDGSQATLKGTVKGDQVLGIAAIAQGSTLFSLRFQGEQLVYTMIPVTSDYKPDMANAQSFPFARQGGAAPGGAPAMGPAAAAAAGAAAGGSFSGTFKAPPGGGNMTFTLQEDAQGRVTGTLTAENGNVLTIDAVKVGATNTAIGAVAAPSGNKLMIKLQPSAGGMGLAIAPKDGSLDNAQMLVYPRVGGEAGGAMPGGGANPPAGDPFVGTFANDKLRLQLQGGGGQYQGQIQFQGQTFAATAQSPDGRSLRGKFTTGAGSFDFTASLQGSALSFSTGGTTYPLQKQGGGATPAPANPLGGGGAGPAGGGASSMPGGGQSVNDPALGLRFTVPAGWKHQKQQNVHMLGHDTIPGMVIITPHTFNSVQEVMASASEPLYQGQDGQLMVSGPPTPLANNIIAADYGGHMQGKQARGRIVAVLSPFGGGMLIMAGTEAASYGPQHAQLAEGIARSMQFSKPEMSGEIQAWTQRLRGKRLTYLRSNRDSGVTGSHFESTERNIYLCSDGTFQGTSQSQIAFDTQGGFGHGTSGGPLSGDGRWEVAALGGGVSLVLRLTNGETLTYRLETNGNQTFLEGQRWFVVENPVCQ